MDLDGSPLAGLLEQRLLASRRATWLERNALEAILREQELAGLMDPGAVGRRVALGRLLKAEILVLLRTASEPAPAARLVVCETTHGLRLWDRTLPLSGDTESDLASLQRQAGLALDKHREEIAEIVAVPPFVSQNLSYQYDYLQGGYAKLIGQMLLDRPGILIVELEEARAVARELALSGTTGGIRRPLPLYVIGEFRHQDAGGKTRVTLQCEILRGEDRLALRTATLDPAEAPHFLREAVSRVIDGDSATDREPPDPKQEARRLGERAAVFRQLGQWEEAAALIEAGLLLAPNTQQHWDAVTVYRHLTQKYWRDPFREWQENLRGLHYYLRGLEHLEKFLERAPDLEKRRADGTYLSFGPIYRLAASSNSLLPLPSRSEKLKTQSEKAKEKEREILLRIIRMRAKAGYEDDARFLPWAVRHLSMKEKYETVYRLLVELQDLPGLGERIQVYACLQYTADILDSPEGRDFLARLEHSGNPTFVAAAQTLRQRVAADKARQRPPPIVEGGPKQVPESQPAKFQPVTFTVVPQGRRGRPFAGLWGGVAAGPGVDVVWDTSRVYVMKQKGRLREVWSYTGLNSAIEDVTFDGRYVWATHYGDAGQLQLLVIDPETETVRPVTREQGLPLQPPVDLKSRTAQTVSASPIAPGRACVAGWFGRAWIALVTVEPEGPGGFTVEVIHEARKAIDPEDLTLWRHTDVAARPLSMFTLADKPLDDPTARRRIVVGRFGEGGGGAYELEFHPLLVDPDSREVSVMEERTALRYRSHRLSALAVRNGTAYFVQSGPDGQHLHLYRLGFPELRPVLVLEDVQPGGLVFDDEHLHLVGYEWWRVRAAAADLLGEVPWYFEGCNRFFSRYAKRAYKYPGREGIRILMIYHSRHYGLVALGRSDKDGCVAYQITFDERQEAPWPASTSSR